MTPINADKKSHIAAVGHDGQHLTVQFKNGGAYRYLDVPAEHHTGMLAADSPGKYLHTNIKGQFKHEKVEI